MRYSLAGYQQTGITYSTTAIDANGNAFAGAANMPYATTYQQMVSCLTFQIPIQT